MHFFKTTPDCIRYFLEGFYECNRTSKSLEELINLLVQKASYSKETAKETVLNAIGDGFLTNEESDPFFKVRLSTLKELTEKPTTVEESLYDMFCFECHHPGRLEHCRLCTRSFHRDCFRRDPQKPLYRVQDILDMQKFRLPDETILLNETDTESINSAMNRGLSHEHVRSKSRRLSKVGSNGQPVRHASISSSKNIGDNDDNNNTTDASLTQLSSELGSSNWSPIIKLVDILRPNKTLITNDNETLGDKENDNEKGSIKHADAEIPDDIDAKGKELVFPSDTCKQDINVTDSKENVDVVCLGQVRSPKNKRSNSVSNIFMKQEINADEFDKEEYDLCTCCRLIQQSSNYQPPNMSDNILNYLMKFSFDRNESWLSTDVPTYLNSMNLNEEDVAYAMESLFKAQVNQKRIFQLKVVKEKLSECKYQTLMEFLVDILDIQHSFGVFFGPHSVEFDSTKFLVRDVNHDLLEISRCPDCYRYSHERTTRFWFALPCHQRHELVYAKCSGFPFWPAKVLRILNNGMFDVRFFGAEHSRAIVNTKNIKPIDSDPKTLKLGNTVGIRKAKEELQCHQLLLRYPVSKFSVGADISEIKTIVEDAWNLVCQERPPHSISRRRATDNMQVKTSASKKKDSSSASSSNSSRISVTSTSFSSNTSPVRSVGTRKSNKRTRSPNDSSNGKRLNKNKRFKSMEAQNEKNDSAYLEAALEELRRKHEQEIRIVKRKLWCHSCLKEAKYLCCLFAAYCSKECQKEHWKNGHKEQCSNEKVVKLRKQSKNNEKIKEKATS